MKEKLTTLARKLATAAACAAAAIVPASAASSSAAASASGSDGTVTYAIAGIVFVAVCLFLYFFLPKLASGKRTRKPGSKRP